MSMRSSRSADEDAVRAGCKTGLGRNESRAPHGKSWILIVMGRLIATWQPLARVGSWLLTTAREESDALRSLNRTH